MRFCLFFIRGATLWMVFLPQMLSAADPDLPPGKNLLVVHYFLILMTEDPQWDSALGSLSESQTYPPP